MYYSRVFDIYVSVTLEYINRKKRHNKVQEKASKYHMIVYCKERSIKNKVERILYNRRISRVN